LIDALIEHLVAKAGQILILLTIYRAHRATTTATTWHKSLCKVSMLLLSLFCFIYLFYSVPPHFSSLTERVGRSMSRPLSLPLFPRNCPNMRSSLCVCVCMCWPKRLAIKPIFRQTKSWEGDKKARNGKSENWIFC